MFIECSLVSPSIQSTEIFKAIQIAMTASAIPSLIGATNGYGRNNKSFLDPPGRERTGIL